MGEKRLLWIDIAKGLAITLMIIGHTVQYGAYSRNFIFSFHMPLFFILTGFTIKIPEDKVQWKEMIRKDVIRIVCPYLGMAFIASLLGYLNYNNTTILQSFLDYGKSVFWGSGVAHKSHPTVGALWFLIVLFWSKQLYRLFEANFKGQNNVVIYIIITILCFKTKWLPQSLDLAFLAMLYLHIGRMLKEKFEFFLKNIVPICCFAGVFWGMCLQNNIYLEMATRSYPFYWISILEAVAASLCIINLSTLICEKETIANAFQWAGINSLVILCVHHLDWFNWFNWVWKQNSMTISCIVRVSLVFLVVYVWLFLKEKMEGKWK